MILPLRTMFLPDAVTRFRQGLGRLIRNEDDQGLIVSFDDRLVSSNYKNFFAQTLENYKQKRATLNNSANLLTKSNIILMLINDSNCYTLR